MAKGLKNIFITVLIVCLGILAYVVFSSARKLEMAKAIIPDPDSVFITQYNTSYPDSHPGVGLIYESTKDSPALLIYYQSELVKQGWKIKDIHSFNGFVNSIQITANKGSSACYLTIEGMESNRKVTIKVE